MSSDNPLGKDETVSIDEWANDLTYKEVHLFTEGFYRGFNGLKPKFGRALQGTVLADSWYAKGGFVIGRMLMYFFIIAGVRTGVVELSPEILRILSGFL